MVAAQPRQRILVEPAEFLPGDRRPARRSAARDRRAPSSGSICPSPDGPSSATVSPGSIASDTPRRISTGPAALARSATRRRARPRAAGRTGGVMAENTGAAKAGRYGPSPPGFQRGSRGAVDGRPEAALPSVMKRSHHAGPFAMRRSCCVDTLRRRGLGRSRSPYARCCSSLMLGSPRRRSGEPAEILVFGDSLIGRLRAAARQARFPARLDAQAARPMGINARVINAGVSGDTTAGGLSAARLGAGRQAGPRRSSNSAPMTRCAASIRA